MRFTRARYQRGSLIREERKVGPDVWIFRWREQTPEGRVKRKVVVGTVEQYRSKAAAQKATEALRVDVNKETWTPSTVAQLVAHYTERELPSKAHSTQGVLRKLHSHLGAAALGKPICDRSEDRRS